MASGAEASGIDPAWRLHDLRHWSRTVAITSGYVRTVAGRLGQANPAMTLRAYAHAVQAADEAVAHAVQAADEAVALTIGALSRQEQNW